METLTKAWYLHKSEVKKQRDVSLMREHRNEYGITGNCFDLALWLVDEFEKEGIEAYPIGHHLGTEHAHAAVMAKGEYGERYLCDLGDQWLQPILIDSESKSFTDEFLSGFFPAANVQVVQKNKFEIEMNYLRPNGKISKQIFGTTPIEISDFLQAAEFSQNHLEPNPLLECRVPYRNEIAHWEFYNFDSVLSTTEGKYNDPPINTIEDWVERIYKKTGYDQHFLTEALMIYKSLKREDN
jgi:hypothetical protein